MNLIGKIVLYTVALDAKQSLFHEVHQGSYSIIFLGYGGNVSSFEKSSYLYDMFSYLYTGNICS